MTLLVEPTTIYGLRRERARELGARFDFAQQQLALYLAVVDTQERVFERARDRKSTRLNSSHTVNSYAVFCVKKKKAPTEVDPRHLDGGLGRRCAHRDYLRSRTRVGKI